ncbi:TolC family protein [uncultured Salinisphaera sp.]|uniref:TolC family protein n=1 Tax=uncultured Salinisphaera sp. TaxID=359372 RepID=UPI0032B2B91B
MSFCRSTAGATVFGACLLLLAVRAGAVVQIPQPLTLDAALAWADEYNPAVRAAAIRIRRLGGEAVHADVAVPSNPRVELEAGRRDQPGGADTDIGIRISQTFWIAGQAGLRSAAADQSLAAAQADHAYLTATVAARTRAAFLSVLVAEQAVTTAERVVDTNRQLDDYARRRLDAGAGTRIETNAARLGLQRARAFAAAAHDAATQARLRLKNLLAIDPARHLSIEGQLAFRRLELPDQARLLDRAVQQRGDLQAAAARIVAARKQLALAERQIIPNLTVFGFYREEAGGRSAGGADITGGGIGFELPLLHRYEGERQIADADLAEAQLDAANLQREVRLQVLSGLSAYRAARERADVLSDAVLDAAQSTLELTRRSFAAGKVGAPAITSAQNNLIDIRRDYLDALASLVRAGTDLERATGGLIVMANGQGE